MVHRRNGSPHAAVLIEDFSGFKTVHSIANQTLSLNYKLINKEQALAFDETIWFKYPMIDEDDVSAIYYNCLMIEHYSSSSSPKSSLNFTEFTVNSSPWSSYKEVGKLIPQAIISLNLLRSSQRNPSLSAYAAIHGNFNATPLALPRTKVIVHHKKRRTVGAHILDG